MLRYVFTVIIAAFGITGCKDPLHNYDECVDIETARCDLRESCLGNENFDKEFPDFDRDTCVAYAKEHCRTRKIGTPGWTVSDLEACLRAIFNPNNPEAPQGVPCESLSKNQDETLDIAQCAFLKESQDSDEPTETETQTVTDEKETASAENTDDTDTESAS